MRTPGNVVLASYGAPTATGDVVCAFSVQNGAVGAVRLYATAIALLSRGGDGGRLRFGAIAGWELEKRFAPAFRCPPGGWVRT